VEARLLTLEQRRSEHGELRPLLVEWSEISAESEENPEWLASQMASEVIRFAGERGLCRAVIAAPQPLLACLRQHRRAFQQAGISVLPAVAEVAHLPAQEAHHLLSRSGLLPPQ
jgi:hypothetical protein